MASPKSSVDAKNKDRRTGFNRRWIKTQYCGPERRKIEDRRGETSPTDLPVPEDPIKRKIAGFEKLMVSTTIQLEAVTRLLLKKGIISENELSDMMCQVQREYHVDPKT